MLTHPLGDMMFFRGLSGLDLSMCEEVVFGVSEEHEREFEASAVIERQLRSRRFPVPWKVHVVGTTESQPETVARLIEMAKVTGPFFIKDADNSFRLSVVPGNVVACADLHEAGRLNAGNKSYVEVDDAGNIQNIVEKRVISSLFCVGGYGFDSAEKFLETFRRLKNDSSLYVSHVIYQMLLDGEMFAARRAVEFADWGTIEEWEQYRESYATLFIDLDGTLVENSAEFSTPLWGTTGPLTNNVSAINRVHATGRVRVVITTSRSEAYREATLEQLARIGLRYDDILFAIPHARRVLINDFSKSNRYPTAISLNVPRNSDDLDGMLRGLLGKYGS
jgi:hypothetical protein